MGDGEACEANGSVAVCLLYRSAKFEINQKFFRRPFTTFFGLTDHFSDGHRTPEGGPWRIPRGSEEDLEGSGRVREAW